MPEIVVSHSCASANQGEVSNTIRCQENEMSNSHSDNRGRKRRRRSKEEIDTQTQAKLRKYDKKYNVILEGCSKTNCKKECHLHFDAQVREEIKKSFWNSDYVSRKLFLRQMVILKE